MDTNKQAMLITKALAYAENGGKPDVSNPQQGKTGEMKSIFQFTPGTWKLYSKQILGKETPLNNETEAYVVHAKVSKWLEDGYNAKQIASMWNAGESKPDAYKQNWKGVNSKYGVAYDTPAYANEVDNYVKTFEKEGTQGGNPQGNNPQGSNPVEQGIRDTVGKIRDLMSKVGNPTPPQGNAPQGPVSVAPQGGGLLGGIAPQKSPQGSVPGLAMK